MIDWSLIPKLYRFAAKDRDGMTVVFSARPKIDTDGGVWVLHQGEYLVMPLEIPGNWQDSLQERGKVE